MTNSDKVILWRFFIYVIGASLTSIGLGLTVGLGVGLATADLFIVAMVILK